MSSQSRTGAHRPDHHPCCFWIGNRGNRRIGAHPHRSLSTQCQWEYTLCPDQQWDGSNLGPRHWPSTAQRSCWICPCCPWLPISTCRRQGWSHRWWHSRRRISGPRHRSWWRWRRRCSSRLCSWVGTSTRECWCPWGRRASRLSGRRLGWLPSRGRWLCRPRPVRRSWWCSCQCNSRLRAGRSRWCRTLPVLRRIGRSRLQWGRLANHRRRCKCALSRPLRWPGWRM